MKKQSLITALVTAGILVPAFAQTVLKMPEKKLSPTTSEELAGAKKTFTKDIDTSNLPFSDRKIEEAYVSKFGSLPARMPAMRNPNGPEDDTQYTYTGFNITAGNNNGTATGGLVNFNINPFACDTVSSDPGLSPYSFVKGNTLYCVLPQTDWTGKYISSTVSTYDADNLTPIESNSFEVGHGGNMSYVPYIISYDDQRDVTYAISMENTKIDGRSGTNYYLNIYDPEQGQVKRLGFLGNWIDGKEDKDQFSLKGFCCGYGTLYVQYVADKVMIGKIDPVSCTMTPIGATEMPTQYVYGVQPMIYDSNAGSLLVNHYDFDNGTQYYKIGTWDKGEGTVSTELIESAPTGFSFFYKRPETNFKAYTYEMEGVKDLKVVPNSDYSELTVTFTVPSKLADGSDIEYPSWVQDTQKGVRANFIIDNNYMTLNGVNNFIPYGTEVTATVPLKGGWIEIGEGLHTYTLYLSSMYNEVGIPRVSITDMLGKDAPGVVGDAALAINDGIASISWSAPTESRYADFGTTVDLNNVKYTVIRDTDGKAVAENIADTKCNDTIEAEEYISYTYTIYASVEGVQGMGTTTNKVSFGKYIALPWNEEFNTADCIDGWTIINANNDGTFRTWQWNSYSHTLYCNWGMGDDWAMTPPIRLEKGNVYELHLNLLGAGELNIYYGTDDTIESQTNKVATITSTLGKDAMAYEDILYYINPAEDGDYRFSLHNYNGNNDTYRWLLNSISVKEAATGLAPAAPTDVTFKPSENGELSGTVSATMPTADNNGGTLSTISKAYVYDATGNKLAETDATPGASVEIPVETVKGWNTLKVVASNENGDGFPVVLKVYSGSDKAPKPTNLKAVWGDKQNMTTLSWDAPTVGENGGYINPDELEYVIYRLDTQPYYQRTELGRVNEPSVDVTILDNDEQDQYVFSVTAVTPEGESDYSDVGILLGEAHELPIEEPFDEDGLITKPWILMPVTNGQNWTVDMEFYNDNVKSQNGDGYQLVFVNVGGAEGSGRFASPIIDFSGNEHPIMKIWLHHTPGMSEETYVVIDASLDGSKDYTALCEPIRLTGGNGWQQHVISLEALKDKKALVGITAYVPNPKDRVFADNFALVDAEEADLAITGISTTSYCKAGETVPVAVTVANMGASVMSDYSVMFNVNGETIDEAFAEEPLAIGTERQFIFNLSVNAADNGETSYFAEVIADEDSNDLNNLSAEVTVELIPTNLPAPENLAKSSNGELTWDAPEVGEGRKVLLDFENTPSFTTDNIEGWTTFDGDGHLSVTFVQYYDNYWPYAKQPLAWMTWSAKEAGCPTAEVWQPYEGDKCLIAWGNYGADSYGRPNDNEPEDDWLISPELLGGTEFSFMTLANDLGCIVEVLYSTTDRNPASFTGKITDVEYSEKSVWNEISATLPEDAKYVALHVVANGFGIMVDNIAYTEAQTPQLNGYNVYRYGPVLESFVDTNNAMASSDSMYAVSAVYDLGESALSNWSKTTGVENVSANRSAKVVAGKGFIVVTGASGENVTVTDVKGITLFNSEVADAITINAASGVYIVRIGDKAAKVIVK